MNSRPRLFPLALCALIFASAQSRAQTIRPGANARGTNRATTGTATRGAGAASANSATTGPRQYRSNTLLGDAQIEIDPETRSLVIVTDEDTHREMVNVIRSLDRPKPQVLIKVVFLQVTYSKGYDVGLEANYIINQSSARTATPAGTTTTNAVVAETGTNAAGGTTTTTTTTNSALTNAAAAAVAAGATKLLSAGSNFGLASVTDGTFVRLLTDDWSATLRALSTRGKVEILSRPSIMARNNQEAVIVVGEEIPFVTNSRVTDLGQTINTIQYDNIGIILRVTPFITSNNMVEMIVAPEISSRSSETVPISTTVSVPVIQKRSAEAGVVTPNGATAVIGGLMQTQRLETIRKIPLLGDIPILGIPFRRTIKDDVKQELLIFLTPTIVQDPSTVEELTTHEVENTELVRKAFSEKEFEKFFDSAPHTETTVEETVLTDKEVRAPEVRRALPITTKTETRSNTSTTLTKPGAKVAPAAAPALFKPAAR